MEEETQTTPTDQGGMSESNLPTQIKDDLWSSRRKMAWVSLLGIILPTVYIIMRITNVQQLEQLGDLMSWYYLALASITGSYFGFKAWATIRGRGRA